MTIHDFHECLKWSHQQEDQPFWGEVYRKAFGDELIAFHSVREDGDAQRAGIDRVLVLSSTKTLKIDEKVRSRHYPDVLLEIWSDYQKKKPGWAHSERKLLCDYIAYAIVPTQTCYLLPYPLLRQAVKRNARDWNVLANTKQAGFSWRDAKNHTYTTRSIAVPTDVLLDTLRECLVVTWEANG